MADGCETHDITFEGVAGVIATLSTLNGCWALEWAL